MLLVTVATAMVLTSPGCATSGTVGTGKVVNAPPKMGKAGLTASQQDMLERGPGRLTLPAIAELIPQDASMRVQLELNPLVQSGLAEALIDALPSAGKARYEALNTKTGVDPVRALDGLTYWTTGGSVQEGSYTMAGMSLVSSRTRAVELIGYFEALEEEMKDAMGEDKQPDSAFEVVVGASVPATDVAQLIEKTLKGVTEIKRTELSPRVAILAGRQDDRLFYAYVWPHGVLAGTTAATTSEKPLHAAAQKVYESVSRIGDAVSGAGSIPSTLPTLEVNITWSDQPHWVRAVIDTRVAVSYEGSAETFGGTERVQWMLNGWQDKRDALVKDLSNRTSIMGKEHLRDLALQALENGELSETADGLRIETEVDVDTLIETLREIQP